MKSRIGYLIIVLGLFATNLAAQTFEFARLIPVSAPKGLCLKGDYIYVAQSTNNSISKIAIATGENVLTIAPANAPAKLSTPYDVEVDNLGNIYVADRGNKRVAIFDIRGEYIGEITCSENVNGVTIGPDGRLYVARITGVDICSGNVIVQTITTLSKDKFREVRKVYFDAKRNLFFVDKNTGIVKASGLSGTTATVEYIIKKEGTQQFNTQAYMGVTSRDELIVSADENKNDSQMGIYRFNTNGTYAGSIGTMGGGSGIESFSAPYGIAIDGNDNLYISDYGNNCIKIWKAVDYDAPTVTGSSVSNITRSSVGFSISCNEPASLRYIISTTKPSADELQSSTQILNIEEQNKLYSFTLPAPLASGLKIYYILTDKSGNGSGILESTAFDTQQELTVSRWMCSSKTVQSIFMEAVANDKGTLYWMVTPYSETPTSPTAEQIVNQPTGSSEYTVAGKPQNIQISPTNERSVVYLTLQSNGTNSPVYSYIVNRYNEIDVMRAKYIELIVGNNPDYTNPYLSSRFAALLASAKQAHQKWGNYPITDNMPPFNLEGASQTEDIALVRDLVGNVLFPLAIAYQLPNTSSIVNTDSRNPETLEKILHLYRYLQARGFVSGSTLEFAGGGVYLGLTGYYYASMLMRDELERANMLDTVNNMMLWGSRWVTATDKEWGATATHNTSKADGVRTILNNRLMSLLTAPDRYTTCAQDLAIFKQSLDNKLIAQSAWDGFIKPDYTGYHHLGIWGNSYITEALHVAAQMAYIVHGTSYALTPESIRDVAQGLLAYQQYSARYDISRGLCGRFPNQLRNLMQHIAPFAYMQTITSGDLKEELGNAFAYLYTPDYAPLTTNLINNVTCNIHFVGGIGSLELMNRLKSTLPAPSQDITLNRNFPYGAMQIHRRNDWMVTIKGYNKYVWDFETNGSENWYGRNQSAGQLSVYNGKDAAGIVTAENSGVGYNGWDWNHTPGVTAFDMPLGDILWEAQKFQWSKFSPEYFSTGVSDEKNGVYGMVFNDIRQAYDYNDGRKWLGVRLSANKSFFFFDDLVIALASDIKNTHTTYNAHTTLFQNLLSTPETTIRVNGEEKSGLGYTWDQSENTAITLSDAINNGYYLPKSKGLHIHRNTQSSRNDQDKADTQGNYATAWIDHGKTTDGNLEYALWVNGGNKINQLANNPSSYYTVKQCDKTAHIVTNGTKDKTGYAIFAANTTLNDDVIEKASEPCVAYVTRNGEVTTLSVANPEFGFYPKDKFPYQVWSVDSDKTYAVAQTQPVDIVLKGEWSTDELPSTVTRVVYDALNRTTTLTFNEKNAKSVTIDLQNRSSRCEDVQNDVIFNLYPNPTTQWVNVIVENSAKGISLIEVYDVAGRMVLSQNGTLDNSNHCRVNMSELSAGQYFIKIGHQTQTIIKQ